MYLEGQICPEKGPKGPFSIKFGSPLTLWGSGTRKGGAGSGTRTGGGSPTFKLIFKTLIGKVPPLGGERPVPSAGFRQATQRDRTVRDKKSQIKNIRAIQIIPSNFERRQNFGPKPGLLGHFRKGRGHCRVVEVGSGHLCTCVCGGSPLYMVYTYPPPPATPGVFCLLVCYSKRYGTQKQLKPRPKPPEPDARAR